MVVEYKFDDVSLTIMEHFHNLEYHHNITISQPIIKEHKHKEYIDQFVDETIKKETDLLLATPDNFETSGNEKSIQLKRELSDFIIDIEFKPKKPTPAWTKVREEIQPYDDSEAYEKLPLSLKRHHKIIVPQRIIKEKKGKEIIDQFVDETIKKNPETDEIKLSVIPTFVPYRKIIIEETEDKNGNIKHSISIPKMIIRENSQHQIVEEFLEKSNLNDDKDFIVKIKFEPKPVSSAWRRTSEDLIENQLTPYDDSQDYEKLPLSLKRHHKIIIPQRINKQHKEKEIIDQFVEETIQENLHSNEFEIKITEKNPKIGREEDIYKKSEHKINLPVDLESKEKVFNQFFENEFKNIDGFGLLLLERKRNTSWNKLQPILKASIPFDPNRNYDENPILLKSVNRFLIPPKTSENEDQRQILRLPSHAREIINDFFKVQEGADGKVSIKVKEATREIPQVTIEEYVSNNDNWTRISQMIVGENQPISSPRHQKKKN